MTRKHFIAIAAAIKPQVTEIDRTNQTALRTTVERLSSVFAAENPNCGLA